MTTTVTVEPGRHRKSPGPASGVFTHRQIMTIIGGLMLGILLAALDQTIVSTAIGVTFLAFVLLLFLKEIPLRNQSGIEALAAELAAETAEVPRSREPENGEADHASLTASKGGRQA